MTTSTIILIIAFICFLLAAFNIRSPLNLTARGHAWCVGAFLVR